MPEFTITLTDKQVEGLRELAAYWNESAEETLRLVAVDGLDLALQVKAIEEREAAGLPPSEELDDDIPF